MTGQEIQILESMLTRIEECESTGKLLMESNKALLNSVKILTESIDDLRNEYKDYTVNSVYEILDTRFCHGDLFFPDIKSIDETLDALLFPGHSICRFGDGEFACISGNLRAKFTTRFYPGLSERLLEVLHSNDEKIMIAIADNYGDLSHYSPQSRREIRNYMTPEVRAMHSAVLDRNVEYFNAYISRPYMFYYNDTDKMQAYWKKIKTLWNKRRITVIEGSNTGMGVGNDLLDNSSCIKRIIAPSVDAYERYDRILAEALRQPMDDLYLIALGPVATVLAYDLAKSGRQAIDIGHLDIEYEWFKKGAYRSIIPEKYVNEVSGGTDPQPILNEAYKKQIISVV